MKNRSKKAVACFLTYCLLLSSCANKNSDKDQSEKQTEDRYTFNYDFDCYFTSDNALSKSGDFVYIAPLIGGLYEYDTQTGKLIELPEVAGFDGGTFVSDLQLYKGKLFSSSWCVSFSSPANFKLLNLDTGEYESLYSVKSGLGAEYARLSDDDNLFYCANLFGDNDAGGYPNHVNEDGYDVIYSLVQYDLNTKETKTLIDGVNYYNISGDRIYFDRIKHDDQSVELYYTDFDAIENGEEPIDTGLNVGSYGVYMWTIRDGLVYFADNGEDNAIKTYDLDTKEIKEVFSTDSRITRFGFMGDYIVFMSNRDGEDGLNRIQLSVYDTKTKNETLVEKQERKEDEGYDLHLSEEPSGFITSDDLDYFIMETMSPSVDERYYKVKPDGSKELILEIYQNPESWDDEDSSENSSQTSENTESTISSDTDSGE